MKIFSVLFLLINSTFSFSQTNLSGQKTILDSGKDEFKFQAKSDTPDYTKAYKILKNQVKLNPDNAELRYFLGYAIDRINANDGKQMFDLKKSLTVEASEQFEKVNTLQPIYKDELIILDPYSKLTSIWGSLAMAYLNKKQIDSAKWAFTEGKKRGGFLEPVLDYSRQLLNSCDTNSILITAGDLISFPAWYLQTIENYRNDISIVDASLIHSYWYPKYLKTQTNLNISFSNAEIDSLDYEKWEKQIVEVVNPTDTSVKFRWELKPTYLDDYILRGDKILLNIIQQNFYTRPIFFSDNSDSSYNLYLTSYLGNNGLVNRLSSKVINREADTSIISKNLSKYNIDNLTKEDINKSRDAIILLNGIRWIYYNSIYKLVEQGNFIKAQELIMLMNKEIPKDKLPFESIKIEKYFTDLFQKVEENN